MSFGTVNIQKLKEEESKPRQLDFSMRCAVVGSDGCGKTSFKDRFCFDRWIDPEAELLKNAKQKKKKKKKSGTIQPLPLPPVVYECGTKEILWSPSTGCHWEEEVKEKEGDLLVEVLMVDSFQKYKTLNHRRGYLRGAQVVAVLYDVGDRDSFEEAKELVKLVNDVCPETGVLNYGSMGRGLSKMRRRIKTQDEGWGKPIETKDNISQIIPITLNNESYVCGILVGCKCDKEPMTDEAIEQRKLEGKTPLHRVVTKEEGERYARDCGFFYHESSPLIDADPNRNRTKNTVTQVWTINSTANDCIQTTIGRCCCKWNNLDKYDHSQYFPLDPMPPLMETPVYTQENGENGENGQEQYDAGYGEEGYVEGGGGGEEEQWDANAAVDGAQDYVEGGVEQQYGEEEQYVGEEEQYVAGEEEQYEAPVVEEEAVVDEAVVEEEEDDY